MKSDSLMNMYTTSAFNIKIPKISTKLSNSGFSLIELSLAAFAAGIVMLIASSQVQMSYQQSVDLRRGLNFQNISMNIMKNLTNDTAWANTFNSALNASSFNCLKTTGVCPSGSFVNVLDKSSTSTFDSSVLTNGYDANGVSCNTYPAAPCLYRAELKWTPICTTNCAATIPIKMDLIWSTADSSNHQNLKLFNISVRKQITNPIPNITASSVTVNFTFTSGNLITNGQGYGSGFLEGSHFSYGLKLSAAMSMDVQVDVCRTYGLGANASNVFYFTQNYDVFNNHIDNCKSYTIPSGQTLLLVSDQIPVDTAAMNRNFLAEGFAISIKGSPQVKVGDRNRFSVTYTDQNNYLDLNSVSYDANSNLLITYRYNEESYLELHNADTSYMFDPSSCNQQLYGMNVSLDVRTLTIPNTCDGGNLAAHFPPGSRVYLKPANTETVGYSAIVVVQ